MPASLLGQSCHCCRCTIDCGQFTSTLTIQSSLWSRYSWHSFRIALCSALKRCNVPDPTIQHLCRWATPESIEIYGRLDRAQYSDFIEAALLQSYAGVQAASLLRPHIDDDDINIRLKSKWEEANKEEDEEDDA